MLESDPILKIQSMKTVFQYVLYAIILLSLIAFFGKDDNPTLTFCFLILIKIIKDQEHTGKNMQILYNFKIKYYNDVLVLLFISFVLDICWCYLNGKTFGSKVVNLYVIKYADYYCIRASFFITGINLILKSFAMCLARLI